MYALMEDVEAYVAGTENRLTPARSMGRTPCIMILPRRMLIVIPSTKVDFSPVGPILLTDQLPLPS